MINLAASMMWLKNQIVFLTLVFALAAPSVRAEEFDCSSALHTRVEIQNAKIAGNKFFTSRNLHSYSNHLQFRETRNMYGLVRDLKKDELWVDMGAGQANALIEGLKVNSQFKALGISYKIPDGTDLSEYQDRLTYLDGDFVENMARDGILNPFVGKTSLITDVYGPISYSEHLPQLFQIYFDLLQVDGHLVFNLMTTSSRAHIVTKKNVFIQNGVEDEMSIYSWLKTIPGIEIVDASSFVANGTELEKSIGFKIRKVSKIVNVPNTLITEVYQEASPATRIFRLEQSQP